MKIVDQGLFFSVFEKNSSPKKLKLKKIFKKTQGNLSKSSNIGAKYPHFTENTPIFHKKNLKNFQKKLKDFAKKLNYRQLGLLLSSRKSPKKQACFIG